MEISVSNDRQAITQINLKLIQTFLLVGETLSFRAAADIAGRSQSAISLQIRMLENQLGCSLFRRTTRNVTLTESGRLLFASALSAIDEIDVGFRRIKDHNDHKEGLVSLACTPIIASTYIAEILAKFEANHPLVRVNLVEAQTADLLDRLRRGQADFGIGPELADSTMDFETIVDDPFVALADRSFVPDGTLNLTITDLMDLPLLTLSAGTTMRRQLDQVFRANGLRLRPRYECIHALTLVSVAEAALGVAILPKSVVRTATKPNLGLIFLGDPALSRRLAVIKLKDQELSKSARALAELASTIVQLGTNSDIIRSNS